LKDKIMATKNAELLRKITIANTGWTKTAIQVALQDAHGTKGEKGEPVAPIDGCKMSLMKIVGETTSAEPGQTDKGEFVKLKGTFTAINSDTGEVFNSAVCLLPNFISDQLAEALKSSARVEFALEIGVKAKASSVTGYEYTATPLIEAQPTDTMQRLLAIATGGDTPALEAPKGAGAGTGAAASSQKGKK
jgi:hypothetical protein